MNLDQEKFVKKKLKSYIHRFGTNSLVISNDPVQADAIPYDSNKYEVLYHDVFNYTPWDPETTYVTYEPYGKYKYGTQNYVPTYEDSIFLSKTYGVFKNDVERKEHPERPKVKTSFRHDFCSNPGFTKEDVDKICNQLPQDVCVDTSCCVSMAGEHCMAGDKQGPWLSYFYEDPFHQNKDYYYYQNKCYGNCEFHS